MNLRKLLPFIFIAEGGLAAFLIGYCVAVFSGAETVFYMVCALFAVAAIVFTALYAAHIKPRFTIVAAMTCIALAVFLYLVLAAVSSLSSIASYRSQLALVEGEDIKSTILQSINRNTIIGVVSLTFAATILPLAIYLPIWYLRRNTVSE